MKKKWIAFLLTFAFVLPLFLSCAPTLSAADFAGTVDAKSAVLMEVSTGRILYEQNADEALPPASVTKVMTLLLVAEAIDAGKIALTDTVTASTRASQMGGSQIYLKEGEQMSVEDLLKSVVMASANDAALALAEAVAGSEEAFVARMNERAAELGMTHTHFENTNGLDDTTQNHVTSAKDIAIMSRELLQHDFIYSYTTLWMDSVRNGAFTLTNTNRLVRFYKGTTGLKTGSTSKAGFCISASAKRDGMELIAVIMASPTRDTRNAAAATLLDYGFANYSLLTRQEEVVGTVPVKGGTKQNVTGLCRAFSCVVDKGTEKKAETEIVMSASVSAPVETGQKIGEAIYTIDGKEVGRSDIVAQETVPLVTYRTLLFRMLRFLAGAGYWEK